MNDVHTVSVLPLRGWWMEFRILRFWTRTQNYALLCSGFVPFALACTSLLFALFGLLHPYSPKRYQALGSSLVNALAKHYGVLKDE